MRRVILSRKGFDSSSGGGPSPILPDGRLVSLPIPSSDQDRYSSVLYEKGRSLGDLMGTLGYEAPPNNCCHLDPDLVVQTVLVQRECDSVKLAQRSLNQRGSAPSSAQDGGSHVRLPIADPEQPKYPSRVPPVCPLVR